ncbi:unnamed protein product [Meloidogyne enterolobii]|uniref:Uncharacterized protein n=1 Tax=Meloidogyne enterolobii TaxID=390850 RepID=A0ACB0YB96_MELEN
MEEIVVKELNARTPSYILAVCESIQEVRKNIKIGKKNVKSKDEIKENKILNIKEIVLRKMTRGNLVDVNINSRKALHSDAIKKLIINKYKNDDSFKDAIDNNPSI